MKKYALTVMVLFLVLLSVESKAQDSQWKPKARGQSDKGQWVVERHKDTLEKQLVSFYTRDNILMYKEEVSSTRVNINKEKTIKRLEQLLATIALAWEQSKGITGSQLVLDYFN